MKESREAKDWRDRKIRINIGHDEKCREATVWLDREMDKDGA